ncbi:glycosyltransferase family 25 protein [Idiomarina abyssalis]|uniref:glycosyltransferase family 25 protein n=1 Tax=Idiomarina abyssalis TaxID=86102 RepID=UPI003A94D88C
MSPLPIFLINLDRSPHRLQDANKSIAELGLKFERISAVDGRTLSNSEISAVYSHELNSRYYHYDLTLGEIACYMSHRKAWQTLLESEHAAAIILEDDIVLDPQFAQLQKPIADLADSPFSDWDVIKLTQPFKHKESRLLKTIGEFQLVDYDKPPMGGCGYLISRQGAKKLLSRELFFRPVDVDLQWQWETGAHVLGLLPYTVDNSHTHESDIFSVANRHENSRRKWVRIKELWRFFWQNRQYHSQR